MNKILCIVQARMGSTRLPGKVLINIDSTPLLQYQLQRLSKSNFIDQIVVATTLNTEDDKIENFCHKNKINIFRGSETDVLKRYYDCAKFYNGTVIVRITADCPLIDPQIIDEAITTFVNNNFDYVSNTTPPDNSTYPDGSDVEVFSFKALKKAFNNETLKENREHVTFQFWKSKEYTSFSLQNNYDLSSYRFTVDYPEDIEVVSFLIKKFRALEINGNMTEIVELLNSYPEIRKINSKYYFGIGWESDE